jgi:oxalate decarboxylase
MAQAHVFHLSSTPPQQVTLGGARINVNGSNFSALQRMALSKLTLLKGGVREPHWHPNAHELGYCIGGQGRVTVVGLKGERNTFSIEKGTTFFIPQSYLHGIENTGDEPLEILLCFNHPNVDEINLSSACGFMSKSVMGALFDRGPAFFSDLHISKTSAFIVKTEKKYADQEVISTESPYRLDLDSTQPQIQEPGGWAKKAEKATMPILEDLALFSLHLDTDGIREPHWHPNAHELNYVIKGKVRITLVSPEERTETFELSPGDVSFLPKGYLHDIENIGQEDVHMAVFFSHASPSNMGLSDSMGAYSPEILGAIFNQEPAYFADFGSYTTGRHILRKYNG